MNQLSNKFGVYEAMGTTFKNKIDAFYATIPHGHFPHWNFCEDIFSKYNWEIEPAESLSELYLGKAMQLRFKYDYIILSWSGGADSQNIAETFVKNNLKIDELIHRYYAPSLNHLITDRDARHLSNEMLYAVPVQIKKLRQYQPDIKLTLWECDKELVEFWQENRNVDDTINNTTPNDYAKQRALRVCSPEALQKFSVIIYGNDKPRILYKDEKFYMYFHDELVYRNTNWLDINDTDVECDLFYWTPESVKLLIKQGHIIKNWFKKNPQFLYLLTLDRSKIDIEFLNEITNSLLYPGHDSSVWQVKKPKENQVPPAETWFVDNVGHTAHTNWQRALTHRSEAIKDMYKNSNASYKLEKGYAVLPGSYSKFYCLGA